MNRRMFFGIAGAAALAPLAATAASTTGRDISFTTIRHRMFDALHMTKVNGFTYPGRYPIELSSNAVSRITDELMKMARSAKLHGLITTFVEWNGDLTLTVAPFDSDWIHTATLYADNSMEYSTRRAIKG